MTTILSVKYEASYSFLKNKQNINWSKNDIEIGMCNNIMRASKIKLLPFDIFLEMISEHECKEERIYSKFVPEGWAV